MYLTLFLFLAVLLLLGIGLLFFLLKVHKVERVYKPKGNFLLSAGEKRFFDALIYSIASDMYICPKVRLADLIEVNISKNDPNFWKYLAPINQKHVDFVICSKNDFTPLVVIELDGGSHNETNRSKRDLFVDSVFASANIPILHIPVKSFYPYEELQRLITSALHTN